MLRGRRRTLLAAAPVRMCLGNVGGDLMPVAAALAELSDGDLCALIDTTNNVTPILGGLWTWIGHACDWELNRRDCVDFPLQPPGVAIPPEEEALSIATLLALRERFNQDTTGGAGAVVALFDAVIRALTGGEHRH